MKWLRQIISGWANLFFGNPEIRKMAAERMAICSRCEFASETIYLHCGKCGCYLPAKTRSTDTECPDGRW